MLLNLCEDGQVIDQVYAGGWFKLPDGDLLSPAYAGWTQGVFTLVLAPPVVEPEPTIEELRASMRMTFAQLLIGLVTEEWITEAEGEAWLQGQLPAALLALIATLPAEERFTAKAHASRPSEVLRLDPLVTSLGANTGKTPEDIDNFFATYSVV